MSVAASVRRRLRAKTPQPPCAQSPLPAPVELGDEAPEDAKRMAYLVTFPHPRPGSTSGGRGLVAPGSMSKTQLLACVRDAFANPVYANPWQTHSGIQVTRLGVWREFHAPDDDHHRHVHDHVAVLARDSFRFLPVKRALVQRHGLASHWSCTHVGYWSCVRYCAMASPRKPLDSLDRAPELWAVDGRHPEVEDCCYAPVTAAAIQAKRQKLVQQAAQDGEREPKINDLDVWALVVRAGVRNTDDDRTAHLQLAAYAKEHCGEAMVHYLWRHRQKLSSMIDDIWQWECIEQVVNVARRTRLESLAAAARGPCTCGGAWATFVVGSFMQNGINIAEICYDVLDALSRGRSETTPVIVLAGRSGGEGKSVFLKCLHGIFEGPGFVFGTPEAGNYPLLDLPHAKVAFLDDFRFDPDVISWAALCLWFDGSASTPQNVSRCCVVALMWRLVVFI